MVDGAGEEALFRDPVDVALLVRCAAACCNPYATLVTYLGILG